MAVELVQETGRRITLVSCHRGHQEDCILFQLLPLPFNGEMPSPSTADLSPSKRRCGLTCLVFNISYLREFSTEGLKIIMYRRTGAYIGHYYGAGTGPIWLDDLQCTGNETSFDNCTHRGWGDHFCKHSEDVSIFCGDSGTLHDFLSPVDLSLLLSLC